MKKLFLLFAVSLVVVTAYAQDKVILKNGEVILDEKKEWAFSKRENTEILHSRSERKNSKRFSKKERYGIEHGQFI